MITFDSGSHNVNIDDNGIHTFELQETNHFHLDVKPNLKAQIILNIASSESLELGVTIAAHANVRLLVVNRASNAKICVDATLLEDSHLVLGLHELHSSNIDMNTSIHLIEPYARVEVVSVVLASDRKHYEMHCEHLVPNTSSDMKNYAVSDKGANYRMLASGEIKRGASFSKSHQANRVLTLSEDQQSEAIPLLLIDEHQVEASHANTMGKMDEDALFYLQSRGLSNTSAKGLLVLSYVLPISEIIEDEDLQEFYVADVRTKVGL